MSDTLLMLAAAIVGALIGGLVAWLIRTQRVAVLEKEIARHEARDESIEQEQQRLQSVVERLSREALKQNNESFLQLAEQNLKKFQSEASADLEKREKAVEQLVKPIQEALKKTESQISEI